VIQENGADISEPQKLSLILQLKVRRVRPGVSETHGETPGSPGFFRILREPKAHKRPLGKLQGSKAKGRMRFAFPPCVVLIVIATQFK
jgi:hypothetical protein